jgi:hypothetical protein
MTLKELKRIIDAQIQAMPRCEDSRVVVILSSPSIGRVANTPVRSAGLGFDWEHGLFLIRTEEPVIKKRKESRNE